MTATTRIRPPHLGPALQLSPAQQQAVHHTGAPLLIVASAGAGKTGTITHRVARIVQDGVDPENILVITFTNRAADEFRGRLGRLLGERAKRLQMGTLHATGAKILRRFADRLGYARNFSIADPGDVQRILKQIMKEQGVGGDVITPAELQRKISRWKEQLLYPRDAERLLGPSPASQEKTSVHLFRLYEQKMLQLGTMDFADLIRNAVALVEGHADIPQLLGVEHLLVDEFQDTDPSQVRMLKGICCDHGNFTAVGDIDQCIYSFRGADPTVMLNFGHHFPGARTISLGQNYRSKSPIVQAAAQLIKNNRDRIDHRIWTENGPGSPIIVAEAPTPYAEADAVVGDLRALHARTQLPYEQMAILYRTNFQSQVLENALVQAGIPYQILGNRFFDRPEVRDTVRYLQWLNQPENTFLLDQLIELPPRGISTLTWGKLHEQAIAEERGVLEAALEPQIKGLRKTAKTGLEAFVLQLKTLQSLMGELSLADLIQKIWELTGLRQWHETTSTASQRVQGASPAANLDELVNLLRNRFDGTTETQLLPFLEYASLMNGEHQENKRGVHLLTMHAAKGAEFKAVALVGCEEGLSPHHMMREAKDPRVALEEERRLFYVGMTRAQDYLYLWYCRERFAPGGGTTRVSPSRFLGELPRELLAPRGR